MARHPGLRMFVAGVAFAATIVLSTGVSFAASAWSYPYIRFTIANESLCGAGGVFSDSPAPWSPVPWAAVMTERNDAPNTCVGSPTGSGLLLGRGQLQQAYAFTYVVCATGPPESAYSSSVTWSVENDLCATSGDHYWRGVTTHGGQLYNDFRDTDHLPLVSPWLLW